MIYSKILPINNKLSILRKDSSFLHALGKDVRYSSKCIINVGHDESDFVTN